MKAADGNGNIEIKQETGSSRQTKADIVLKKLRATRGTTIEGLMEITGWQAHSVRGFFSAVVRKKLGLVLASEVGKDGIRRYRIDGDAGTDGYGMAAFPEMSLIFQPTVTLRENRSRRPW